MSDVVLLIEAKETTPLVIEQECGENDSRHVGSRDGQPDAAEADEFGKQQQEDHDAGQIPGEGGDGRSFAIGDGGEETGGKEVEAGQQEAEAKEQEAMDGDAVSRAAIRQEQLDQGFGQDAGTDEGGQGEAGNAQEGQLHQPQQFRIILGAELVGEDGGDTVVEAHEDGHQKHFRIEDDGNGGDAICTCPGEGDDIEEEGGQAHGKLCDQFGGAVIHGLS